MLSGFPYARTQHVRGMHQITGVDEIVLCFSYIAAISFVCFLAGQHSVLSVPDYKFL